MAEYIKKWFVVNKLIELENEFQRHKPFSGSEHDMYRKICEVEMAFGKTQSADVVEVVRCKDCKHWNEDALACDLLPWVDSSEHENWYEDDFCSYGERRTDE